ncbi:MATE family efflux transporter [Streptococcaceae bacterium ESL0687]|nr:MATE family efflux transporter [Streptococcaceae bacterium ESL0687]
MNENTKKLLSFSLPAILENILQTSLGFVDSILISKISLVAVGAVSISNGLIAIYQAIFIALTVAISTTLSANLGASENRADKKISQAVAASLKLSILFGIFMGLVSLIFAGNFLSFLGARGEILDNGLVFFRITGGSSIAMVLLTVLAGMIRSTGDSKSPLYVNLIVNLLNLIFNYLLIFGFMGIPALGIVGSALGTSLARFIGVALLFLKIQKTAVRIDFKALFSKLPLGPIFLKSLPIMGERLTMRMGDLVIFAIVIAYGNQVFVGNSIGETITSYNYLPAFGMATGISILVAHEYGEKNRTQIKALTRSGVVVTSLISTLLGAMIYFSGSYLNSLFTSDPQVIKASMIVLFISFISEPVVSAVLIYTASLQAMGDVKTPFYATSIGMWFIRIGLAYVLGSLLGLELLGVWLATLIDNIFRYGLLKRTYINKINKITSLQEL